MPIYYHKIRLCYLVLSIFYLRYWGFYRFESIYLPKEVLVFFIRKIIGQYLPE